MKEKIISDTIKKTNLIGLNIYSFEYLNKKTYKENYILNISVNKHYQKAHNNLTIKL